MHMPRWNQFLPLVAAALTIASSCANALTIAVTNDDGWESPGVRALANALTEAGHDVIVAAPIEGTSGLIPDINDTTLQITREQGNVYSVAALGEGGALIGGTLAATSAGLMAIDLVREVTGMPPDLLISGIHDGVNVGAGTIHSSTVRTVITSVNAMFGEPVPAIAVSTPNRCATDSAECDEVAAYVVGLVNFLQVQPPFVAGESGLLPEGYALNVNYPADEPLGQHLCRQGRKYYLEDSANKIFTVDVGCTGDCSNLAIGESAEGGITGVTPVAESDHPNSDTEWFRQGYITIVPIMADYTAFLK